MPVGLDLAEYGVVGVAGPTAPVRALARWLVAQAPSCTAPGPAGRGAHRPHRAEGWAWVRWLPHAAPSGGGGPLAAVGTDPETVANRARRTRRRRSQNAAAGPRLPHGQAVFTEPDVLVVLDGARRLRALPGMVQVLRRGPRVGVYSVCLDEEERLLPEECRRRRRLRRRDDACGCAATASDAHRRSVADLVAVAWCEPARPRRSPRCATSAATTTAAALPGAVRLLDLLGLEPPTADAVAARWRGRPATPTLLLGVGYDGAVRARPARATARTA